MFLTLFGCQHGANPLVVLPSFSSGTLSLDAMASVGDF
jgi:hypothetical protein